MLSFDSTGLFVHKTLFSFQGARRISCLLSGQTALQARSNLNVFFTACQAFSQKFLKTFEKHLLNKLDPFLGFGFSSLRLRGRTSFGRTQTSGITSRFRLCDARSETISKQTHRWTRRNYRGLEDARQGFSRK